MENSVDISQKIKNRTTILSSNSASEYFYKENKDTNSKAYVHPNIQWSIIHNSQYMEAIYVPTDSWMCKNVVMCVYNRILLSHKKNEILTFVTTWMDLEGIILSKVSQTEKNKYQVISLICGL